MRDLPHPSEFRKGSKWRCHTQRRFYGGPEPLQVGDEFTVTASFNNVTPTFPIASETYFAHRTRSDSKKYGTTKTVTGSLRYVEIYRFVERVSLRSSSLYYISTDDQSKYFPGEAKLAARGWAHDFSEAQYFSSELFALKGLLRTRPISSWHNLRHLHVFAYNVVTKEHTRLPLPPECVMMLNWINSNMGMILGAASGRIHPNLDLIVVTILKNRDKKELFVAKGPSHKAFETEYPIHNRLTLFHSLDDAMLFKMSVPNVEIRQVV